MHDDLLTHTIKIEVRGHYPHGTAEHSCVSVAGDGQIEHYLDAFRAALVAAGFSPFVAMRLGMSPAIESTSLEG